MFLAWIKNSFLMFPVEVLESYAFFYFSSGISQHCKIDEFPTIVALAYLEILVFKFFSIHFSVKSILIIIIFRPHKFICEWGGGKKIIIGVGFFLPILPYVQDLHPLQLVPNLVSLAHLVVRLPGKHEVVGFAPLLMRYIFSGKYRCLAGVLL